MKMRVGIVGIVVFSFFVSISARSSALKIEKLRTLQDYFAQENSFSGFVRATLEDSSEPSVDLGVTFELPADDSDWNDGWSEDEEDKTNGYLDLASAADIRLRLKQDFAAECNVLLHDFFNGELYSSVRNKIKTFVATTVPHSFLTQVESNQLVNLGCYYPHSYADATNSHGYAWEYVLGQDGKPEVVRGRSKEIVGLKGNNDYLSDAFFVMIQTEYSCLLDKNEKRLLGLNNKTWGQYALVSGGVSAEPLIPAANITTINVLVGPNHSLKTTITFFRKYKDGKITSVAIDIFAYETERVTLTEMISTDTCAIEARHVSVVSDDQTNIENKATEPVDMLDVVSAVAPKNIWSRCSIISTKNNESLIDALLEGCPSFVIKTAKQSEIENDSAKKFFKGSF